MIKRIAYFTSLLGLLLACNQDKKVSPYPGYEFSEKGFYFKRLTIGEGINGPQVGDSIYLKVIFKDSLQKTLFNSSESNINGCLGFKFTGDQQNNIEQALYTMVEGDSTHFIIIADSLYKQCFGIDIPKAILKGQNLLIEALFFCHKSKLTLEKEKKSFEVWCREMKIVEVAKLKEYCKKNKVNAIEDSLGMICLKYVKGSGPPVFNSPYVLIYLKGTFLDGTEFDNSFKSNQPLEYVPGNSGQLIKGLEKIVGTMKIGAKAKIIIPSQLAFGSLGSSTGIVAPFTSVIYELEIKKEKLNVKIPS